MGGYALTLIDALDSFVLLGDKKGFEDAVRLVTKTVNFDIDAKVQVFEVTIRIMGGLVSNDSIKPLLVVSLIQFILAALRTHICLFA